MVTGSSLGGILADYIGYRGAVLVSAIIMLFTVIIDLIFLPEIKPDNFEKEEVEQKDHSLINQFKEYFRVLSIVKIRDILIVITLVSFGIGLFQNIFPIAAKLIYNMESTDLGFYISFAAFIGLIGNVFVLNWSVKLFGIKNNFLLLGNYYSIIVSIFTLISCYIGYSLTTNYYILLLITIPSALASTILYTLSSSLMSLAVTEDSTGTAISMSHSSRSLIGIITPLLGGLIFEFYNFYYVCISSAFCMLICLFIIQFFVNKSLKELEIEKSNQISTTESKD
jgi:predicted MFS family arabinose efflux permease